MGKWLDCFKAYDVRGKVPSELNPEIAYNVGRAFADEVKPKQVCIGYDIRLSGPALSNALIKGLNDAGVNTIDLGMVGTEMIYFATAHYNYDGGIMITASHNPAEYNGFKMVRSQSRPISGDTGLSDIERRAFEKKWEQSGSGQNIQKDVYPDFINHLIHLIEPNSLKPLKVLANPGNGAAGLALKQLESKYPLQIKTVLAEPDGHFPNGVPNPILEESRAHTLNALSKEKADFSVAWDGDYDRCFFFDENGNFIEGYYIVGLLAESMLMENPGEAIIYDPRLYWNTLDIIQKYNGRGVMCKTGHAFIKEKMRAENAIYGGEMSAHHYFRDHWYCDSGMIPFLLVARLISQTGRTLSELVGEMIKKYPCSGEINSTVNDPTEVLTQLEKKYATGKIDRIDGLSIEFPDWRFNVRSSNTEPVMRLNVESKGNQQLMEEKVNDLLMIIRAEKSVVANI